MHDAYDTDETTALHAGSSMPVQFHRNHSKILNGSLNCLDVNFSRYILSGIILLPLALLDLRKRQVRLNRTHFLWFQLLGFIGIALVGPAYQLASWLLQANVTSILFSLNPMFIAIMAMVVLGEPLSHHQWAALLFDIGAVFVLVNPMQMTMDPIGLLLLFFTIFCYSFYAVIGKKMIDELGSAMATAGSFLAGGVQLFLLACCTHIPFVAEWLVQVGLSDFAEVSLLAAIPSRISAGSCCWSSASRWAAIFSGSRPWKPDRPSSAV